MKNNYYFPCFVLCVIYFFIFIPAFVNYCFIPFYYFYPYHIENLAFPLHLQLKKYYSTYAVVQLADEKVKLNPWWLTGFIDGEGSFKINIYKMEKMKVGWCVQVIFSMGLQKNDIAILEENKMFWGIGSITKKHGPQSVQLQVKNIEDLKVIINHFYKYPLITKKLADYKLWKQAYYLMLNKEHLTEEGLHKIIAIRASLNLGLSPELELAFPKIAPVERPSVLDQKIKDPNWIAGFASAEGSFMVKIYQSNKLSLGSCVSLVFQITQHSRDKQLMENLIDYFGCGGVHKNRNWFDYRVTKFEDIITNIIPFFQINMIQGVKTKNFKDWCLVAELMKDKQHLTKNGLEQIKKIKAGMNKKRK